MLVYTGLITSYQTVTGATLGQTSHSTITLNTLKCTKWMRPVTKKEILDDMLVKHHAYVDDWHNTDKWEAYKAAWQAWRQVKGDE